MASFPICKAYGLSFDFGVTQDMFLRGFMRFAQLCDPLEIRKHSCDCQSSYSAERKPKNRERASHRQTEGAAAFKGQYQASDHLASTHSHTCSSHTNTCLSKLCNTHKHWSSWRLPHTVSLHIRYSPQSLKLPSSLLIRSRSQLSRFSHPPFAQCC